MTLLLVAALAFLVGWIWGHEYGWAWGYRIGKDDGRIAMATDDPWNPIRAAIAELVGPETYPDDKL